MSHSTKILREIFIFGLIAVNLFLSYSIYQNYFASPYSKGISLDSEFLFPFLATFGVLLAIELIPFLALFRKMRRKTTLATGRLLSYKDLKSEQKRVRNKVFLTKKERKFQDPESGLLLSQHIKITLAKCLEHLLVFAPTGSGKTSSILIPLLLALNGFSIVVTDPKGEIHQKTKKAMRDKGYKIAHLNLYDPNNSISYDLLANCKSTDDVRKLSESILGNDEWGKLSQTLLQAFLFKAFEKGENLSDVVDSLADSPTNLDSLAFEFDTLNSREAQRAFNQFKKTAQGEGFVSSIFGTIQSRMKVFEKDKIRLLSAEKSFDMESLRDKKTIVYVSYPEDESELYAAFLSSFYYQVLNKLKAHPSVDETQGNSYGLPVFFLLDEFANIGVIPEFDKFLSTIRSKKMSVVLFLQSFGQLTKVYDKAANIILENCKTKITMSGVTNETAEVFSQLVGRMQYKAYSYSGGNKDISTSVSDQTKEVLSADDIRRLRSYEMLIVSDNLRPIKDDKNFYYYDKIQFFIYKNSPFSLDFNNYLISLYSKSKKRLRRA